MLKPLFGAQGRGLRLLMRRRTTCPSPDEVGGVYYLQRFVAGPGEGWRDFRVFVGRPARGGGHAPARRQLDHQHRPRRPGRSRCRPRGGWPSWRSAAAAAVGADHAGVDLIVDRDGGLQVLEVNSMPAWQGLQSGEPARTSPLQLARHLAARVGLNLRAAV